MYRKIVITGAIQLIARTGFPYLKVAKYLITEVIQVKQDLTTTKTPTHA